MEWTKDIPKVEGFYWMMNEGAPYTVEYWTPGTDLRFDYYCGPIQEPPILSGLHYFSNGVT